MSTDKENAENGTMEVEETSNETLDTKPTIDVEEVSEETSVKLKEKDVKKKIRGKEAKKESKSLKPKENKTGKLKNEDSESEENEEDDEDEDDEENDENDENEKSGDDKVPLLDQPLELSGTRERKKVQRFSAEYKTEPKDAAPIEIPEGRGTQLGNIPRIEANIQKSRPDALKPLHKLLFIRVGKANFLKKNIRKFNGFDFTEESDQYAKKKQSIIKFETRVLREICTILDLKKPVKRDELVDTIISFLMKPEDSGKPVSKARPKRAARSNHKSYSESEDDDDEKERKSSRKGKKKRASLKEVSSDGEEDEDFENESNEKGDEKDDDNLADAVKNKEKIDSKGNDSDKGLKENETDEDDIEEEKDEESSDYSEDEKTKSKKGSRSAKNNKKQSTKKTNSKKPTSKKSDKKPPTKKRAKSDDESSEDEPLAKKSKAPPTDEEIKSYVKEILEGANLEETTMKIVCKQVYAHYPEFDLSHKKDFIKTTVKSLIST